MNAWTRLRPALAELALVFAGMLAGFGVLLVFGAPGGSGPDRVYTFVWGPIANATAAVFYRWASKALQSDGSPSGLRVDPAFSRGGAEVPLRRVSATVAIAIAAAIGGSFVLGELVGLLGFPVEEQKTILDIIASAKDRGAVLELVILGTAAVVLAPIAEEWLFRGLFFRRLLQVSGRPEAYVLSSVAFAAIHTNPAGFIIYAWLGVCFAVTIHRTGKLWAAVVVHAANNAFAYALLVSG